MSFFFFQFAKLILPYPGKDGFDIQVGKNTDLKGAVIASNATPDKNKLSTGTLTYSDIQNKAEYNAESSGYSGTQKGSSGYSPGIPMSGNAGSTTQSAIAPGTIVVGGKAVTPESLRRDTTTALNELGKIFDKKIFQEKQELVNLFSKEANQAIGDFAESMRDNAKTLEEKAKWAQGGEYKAILHAFVSGFTSSLSGNDFLSGAIGDGISQLAQKQLANIKDPTLRLFASAAIGAGAAKAVGGNAKIGAIISYNGVKYNDLADHWITLDGVRVLFSGYVVIEAGKQFLKDQAGNIIGTWVAETEEWVSNTFNSPGTDISTPNGSTVFDNPANNPSMGGTTMEGEEQGGISTTIPSDESSSGIRLENTYNPVNDGNVIVIGQQPLGRGNSRGGHQPETLVEQLAVEQAISNPQVGRTLDIPITDSRWFEEGWVKKAQNINGVEVHYVYNTNTGEIDDFKIK